MPLPIMVTLAELAELFDLHPNTVATWVKGGLPVADRKGSRGSHRIDLGTAIRWVRAKDQVAAEEKLAAARDTSRKQEALTRKAVADARLAELAVAEREGELVPAAQVSTRWDAIMLAIKERILALPPKAVQVGTIPADRETQLATLCRDVLRELAEPPGGSSG